MIGPPGYWLIDVVIARLITQNFPAVKMAGRNFGGKKTTVWLSPCPLSLGGPPRVTNSAHDTGVMSESEKGNCMKELEVQFLSSNSSDETERMLEEWARSSSFSNTCRCGVGASGGKVGVCVRCCVQHQAHNLLSRTVGNHLLVALG